MDRRLDRRMDGGIPNNPIIFLKRHGDKKLCPRLAQKNVLLLHDNAPSHTASSTIELINSFKWQLLFHPLYSPDLAPRDFYLFPELKKKDLLEANMRPGGFDFSYKSVPQQ